MYTKGMTLDGARNTLKNIHESLCCSIEKMKQTTGKKFRSSSKNTTSISKEKIMNNYARLVHVCDSPSEDRLMSYLNLWENPLLTESLRLEIATGEINRLNRELADTKRKADHYENEWSDVCNENQKLINEIRQLKGIE